MNLAPWKYRNVLAEDHGPIISLEVRQLQSPFLNSVFEAYATLDPSVLSRPVHREGKIYGAGDGSGTSIYQNQAQHKAVSEALERWAFYETYDSADRAKFGFDRDSSTTGMACFPGLTKSEARQNALYEARERWSLCAWWENKISAKPIEFPESHIFRGVELLSAWPDSNAVLIWAQIPETLFYCYGFSCAKTQADAVRRASVELDRNRRVLSSFVKQNQSVDSSSTGSVSDGGEKRLIYFSSEHGHAHFQDRIQKSIALPKNPSLPSLIVDATLPGRWTKYAHVWRCLYEPIGDGHGGDQPDYFFF